MEMLFYFIITLSTLAIVLLTILVWLKTKTLAFLFGIMIIYYYSLLGAWKIIYDEMNQKYNSYQYLYTKMFSVTLDYYYFITLILYTLFVITIITCLLIFANPYQYKYNRSFTPFYVRHVVILVISCLSLFFSYYVIRNDISNVIIMSRSLYHAQIDWTKTVKFYTISVELNIIAFTSAIMGLAVFCSGKKARFIIGVEGWWVGICYTVLIAGLIIYNFLQGNRSPMVVNGLAFTLFFLVNSGRSSLINKTILGGFLTLALVFLVITTLTRGLPATEIYQNSSLEIEYVMRYLAYLISSPEKLCSHFSLYGVLSFDVPLIYGSSFISLLASLVPRILWPDRPDDTYVYYAESVSAATGQGYTIHHATGWYLNFGVPGVVLGAIFIGLLWVCIHNLHQNFSVRKSPFLTLGAILIPWIFVGHLPILLRSGIEGYKNLFFNVILFPTFVFYMALCRKPLER